MTDQIRSIREGWTVTKTAGSGSSPTKRRATPAEALRAACNVLASYGHVGVSSAIMLEAMGAYDVALSGVESPIIEDECSSGKSIEGEKS